MYAHDTDNSILCQPRTDERNAAVGARTARGTICSAGRIFRGSVHLGSFLSDKRAKLETFLHLNPLSFLTRTLKALKA